MNPEFLLGIDFNIPYWHRKYHSGTICKGVINGLVSNELSGCDKVDIVKYDCIIYSDNVNINVYKSLYNIYMKNGILLLVLYFKGLLDENKCR